MLKKSLASLLIVAITAGTIRLVDAAPLSAGITTSASTVKSAFREQALVGAANFFRHVLSPVGFILRVEARLDRPGGGETLGSLLYRIFNYASAYQQSRERAGRRVGRVIGMLAGTTDPRKAKLSLLSVPFEWIFLTWLARSSWTRSLGTALSGTFSIPSYAGSAMVMMGAITVFSAMHAVILFRQMALENKTRRDASLAAWHGFFILGASLAPYVVSAMYSVNAPPLLLIFPLYVHFVFDWGQIDHGKPIAPNQEKPATLHAA